MKKRWIVVWLFMLCVLKAATAQAQNIPFLNDLLARNAAYQKLYNEKRRGAKSLPNLEPLRLRGEQAFRTGNVPEMLATLSEGIALLEGRPWDERQKFFASLTIETNCLVLEPNAELQVSLTKMFLANEDKAFSKTPTVTFELRATDSKSAFKPITISSNLPVAEDSTLAARRVFIPDGEYTVVAVIESDGKKLGEVRAPIYAIADFTNRIKAAQAQADAIKVSTDAKVKTVANQVTTPEFWLQRIAAYNRSAGEEPPNPVVELTRIESSLAALSKGENPFSSERGQLERAYRDTEGKLVPYRLYVPKSYDGTTARPLVVLLHGALGDEKTYFSDLYDKALITGEAETRGWIFVAPNGRGRFNGYGNDNALADVVKVIEMVRRDYKTDAARTYLTGHSMGGGGTWQVATARPELFAAIAPVASGRAQGEALNRMLQAVKPLPVFIIQGAKDGIVPPQGSREMHTAAQKAGLNVKYLEMPNEDHLTIVGSTIVEVLNFFEKNVKASLRQ